MSPQKPDSIGLPNSPDTLQFLVDLLEVSCDRLHALAEADGDDEHSKLLAEWRQFTQTVWQHFKTERKLRHALAVGAVEYLALFVDPVPDPWASVVSNAVEHLSRLLSAYDGDACDHVLPDGQREFIADQIGAAERSAIKLQIRRAQIRASARQQAEANSQSKTGETPAHLGGEDRDPTDLDVNGLQPSAAQTAHQQTGQEPSSRPENLEAGRGVLRREYTMSTASAKVVPVPLSLKHFDLPAVFTRAVELGSVIGEADLLHEAVPAALSDAVSAAALLDPTISDEEYAKPRLAYEKERQRLEARSLTLDTSLRGLKRACERLAATLFPEGHTDRWQRWRYIEDADCSPRAIFALHKIEGALRAFEQHVAKHAAGYAPGDQRISSDSLMYALGNGVCRLWEAMSPHERQQVEHLVPHIRNCWGVGALGAQPPAAQTAHHQTGQETATTPPAPVQPVAAKEPEAERRIKERLALAELLTHGPNASRIARSINVPRTTLLSWPTFREHYNRAKDKQLEDKERRRQRLQQGDRDEDEEESDEA